MTWQGIALHGGDLPGYPASHGCIRLPKEFAKLLYSITTRGTRSSSWVKKRRSRRWPHSPA